MSSITLHKEYGLNPTLSTCFYCGKPTGEIALLGNNYKGKAPQYMCTSLEPCPECKEKYKDYVLLVEATQEKQSPWGSQEKPQPTGRWLAVKKELVTVPNKGICFVDTQTFETLLSKAKVVA